MKKLLNARGGVRTVFHGHSDGTFTIETVEDAEPVIERNKAVANEPRKRGDGLYHAATVPVTMIYRWMVEDGVSPQQAACDPDWLKRVAEKRLNSSEYQYLRTIPGKI